ncbi:MAG: hypothetical protein GY704_04545, partial [Phycisphaeraceae bacterium]|nr:hypothetical protein [Phycisphaeraceae bacterium]
MSMDGTVQKIEVTAPQQFVYETALDLETYPIWAGGVKSVTVVEEDEYGRPTVADFTIDAMAVAVSCESLIDRLGGRQDLASKKIRMVSVDVFRKDPVRLIRAYR